MRALFGVPYQPYLRNTPLVKLGQGVPRVYIYKSSEERMESNIEQSHERTLATSS